MYDPKQAKLIEAVAASQRPLYGYFFVLAGSASEAEMLLRETNLGMMSCMESMPAVAGFRPWVATIADEIAGRRRRQLRDAGNWCFDDDLSEKLAESARARLLEKWRWQGIAKALRETSADDRLALAERPLDARVSALRLGLYRHCRKGGQPEVDEGTRALLDQWMAGKDVGEAVAARLRGTPAAMAGAIDYLDFCANLNWEVDEGINLSRRLHQNPRPRRPVRWKLTAAATLALTLGVAALVIDHDDAVMQRSFDKDGSIAGVVGQALELRNEPLSVPLPLDASDKTVVFWVRVPAQRFVRSISARYDAETAVITVTEDGRLQLEADDARLVGISDLRDGDWHQIVCTATAVGTKQQLTVMIDGRLEIATERAVARPIASLVLVANGSLHVDELAVYDRAIAVAALRKLAR